VIGINKKVNKVLVRLNFNSDDWFLEVNRNDFVRKKNIVLANWNFNLLREGFVYDSIYENHMNVYMIFQFAKILSGRPNYKVIATCRDPDSATELSKLSNVDILKVDITRTSEIEAAAEKVRSNYGKVDLLINSAGILHPSGLSFVLERTLGSRYPYQYCYRIRIFLVQISESTLASVLRISGPRVFISICLT